MTRPAAAVQGYVYQNSYLESAFSRVTGFNHAEQSTNFVPLSLLTGIFFSSSNNLNSQLFNSQLNQQEPFCGNSTHFATGVYGEQGTGTLERELEL